MIGILIICWQYFETKQLAPPWDGACNCQIIVFLAPIVQHIFGTFEWIFLTFNMCIICIYDLECTKIAPSVCQQCAQECSLIQKLIRIWRHLILIFVDWLLQAKSRIESSWKNMMLVRNCHTWLSIVFDSISWLVVDCCWCVKIICMSN